MKKEIRPAGQREQGAKQDRAEFFEDENQGQDDK
jgi:hypothetical protein